MDLQGAIQKIKDTRDNTRQLRSHEFSRYAMACCYAYGKQWAYLSSEGANLSAIRQLKRVTDPRRSDVRFALNKILPAMREMRASLNPQRMAMVLNAAHGMPDSTVVKYAGESMMTKHLENTKALRIYRDVNEIRLVMGTGVIKRTRYAIGTRGEEGGPKIRDWQCAWAAVYPFEIIRDPSAMSTNPADDEELYIHEKPRSVAWVQRHYGVGDIKTEKTLTDLNEYRRQIRAVTGDRFGIGAVESQHKAVRVGEAYFKDPDRGPGWTVFLPYYINEDDDNQEPIPLVDDLLPNPYDVGTDNERLANLSLPFHHFDCETQLMAPWSKGIPDLLMPAQDLYNWALTWHGRLLQAGAGKIVYEVGTVEKPAKAFNNRIDVPIPWRRVRADSAKPDWMAAPQIPQAANAFMGIGPDHMDTALNRSGVQRGESSKRGESAEAIREKLAAANMPLEDRRREDELRLQELLYATTLDVMNPKYLRLDQARKAVGPDMPESYLLAMLRQQPCKNIRGVTLMPNMLRPKTPAETKEDFVALATAQIISSVDAQREMTKRGVEVNSLMRGNIEKQTAELASIIAGEETKVAMDDDHDTQRYVIRLLVGSPQWHAVPEEAQQAIEQHAADHLDAQMQMAQLEAQVALASQPQPQQPSPPGEAVAAATGMGPGTVTPGV